MHESASRAGDPTLEVQLDGLARSRGALRRVLAGVAAEWVARRQWDRVGYARVGDHARERLGLSERAVYELARTGRALEGLPRLEAALISGLLSWSKARLLARFVTSEDEGRWISWARGQSVRVLEKQVRAVDRGAVEAGALGDEEGGGDEPVGEARLGAPAAVCFKWQRTRTWAARVAGERVSAGTALEMVTAEVLSGLPGGATVDETEAASPLRFPAADVCATHAQPSPGEDAGEPEGELPAFLRPLLEGLESVSVHELDARLRRVVRLEQRVDAELAPLIRRVTSSGHEWRDRPLTLPALARERLGMSPRKARALVSLERAGDVCPELRRAFRGGALSWVQAQILVPLVLSDAEGGWRAAWCRFAQEVTVRRLDEVVGKALLLRDAEPERWAECRDTPEGVDGAAEEAASPTSLERQTCARPTDPLGGMSIRVKAPTEVVRLFRAVLCSLRRALEAQTGRLPSEAEAFDVMLDHALRSWGVEERLLRRFAVFQRDGWRCTVPGCTSQRNLHLHHVRFRSAGGGDEPGNLTTLCAAHHHRGVHAGYVRVGGQAPDRLWFELGVREGKAPLARYRSGDRVMTS